MMDLIRAGAIVLITAVVVLAFTMPPPLASMQSGKEASRIFFFHVPMAQMSFVAFIVAAVYGVSYLRTRRVSHDHRAATSAELGLTFSIVASITGALWARQAWGAYWNWDPRQLFLFVMILIYGAFFALRQATGDVEVRRRLSAVYLIMAGAISPFLYFVLPRLYTSLHGDANQVVLSAGSSNMSGAVGAVFASSIIGFALLYVWLLDLGTAAARVGDTVGAATDE
ncbi:MAG TPA: cytochrome c biogenesis protein CcsA [candidate division Zixibacteria bacterium]|jgi:heme exporter protein C